MNTDLLLCKAKSPYTGEWVEGYAVMFECKGGELWYINNGDLHDVNLNTLCRCTGKKDSTGKLVFEGDLFVDTYGKKVIIEWDDETCEFVGIIDTGCLNINEWAIENETIEGNIHD